MHPFTQVCLVQKYDNITFDCINSYQAMESNNVQFPDEPDIQICSSDAYPTDTTT